MTEIPQGSPANPSAPDPLTVDQIIDLLIRGQTEEGSAAVRAEAETRLSSFDNDEYPAEALWCLMVIHAVRTVTGEFPEHEAFIDRYHALALRTSSRLWHAHAHAVIADILSNIGAVTRAFIELSRGLVLLDGVIDEDGTPRDPDLPDSRDGVYLLGTACNSLALALTALGVTEHATQWYHRAARLADHRPAAIVRFTSVFNPGWLHFSAGVETEILAGSGAAHVHFGSAAACFERARSVDTTAQTLLRRSAEVMFLAASVFAGDPVSHGALRDAIDLAPKVVYADIGRWALARLLRQTGDLADARVALESISTPAGRSVGPFDVLLAGRSAETVALDLTGREPTAGELAQSEMIAMLLRARQSELDARATYFHSAVADERQRRIGQLASEQLLVDDLTGLSNRRRLDAWTAEHPRGDHVVVFLDVDDFKSVNDEISHLIGDLVLQELAELLRSAAGPQDLAVRFGGDEFILVLGPDESSAEELITALATALAERTLHHPEISRAVRLSYGIIRRTEAMPWAQALVVADERMLAHKKSRAGSPPL